MSLTQDPETAVDFDAMLRFAVQQALAFNDFQTAFESFLAGFRQIAPGFAANIPVGGERSIGHAIFREVWKRTPRPDSGWKRFPLPKPERNNACPCGSGTKYKQCCGPLDSKSPFPNDFSVLSYVIETVPESRYGVLPFKQLDPEELAHVANQWMEDGRNQAATLLLEALLVPGNKLDARHEHAFDILCDLYFNTFREADRLDLVERIMQSTDKQLRASACHRRATMHADSGEHAQAWQVFKEAQRLDPDNPSLAHLELIMLANQDRYDEVGARAVFWAKRLTKLGYAGDPIVELMNDIARDPDVLREIIAAHDGRNFEDTAYDMDEEIAENIAELYDLIENLPAPRSHYALSPSEDSAGSLEPSRKLAAIERAWEKLYWNDAEARDPWSDTRWLDWLQTHPLAWQSFLIIEDIVTILENDPILEDADEHHFQMVEKLIDHAVAVLRKVFSANKAEGLKFEWGWLDNRPALRLLLQTIDMARYSEKELPLLEWLVLTLNPSDNGGHRERLVHAYCEAGRPADALAVCDRYPEDTLPGILYGRVLALYLLDRHGDAVASLKRATDCLPKVLKTLVAARPKMPPLTPGMVTHGGKDEAWMYHIHYRHTWKRCKAFDWLKKTAGRK